MRYHDTTMPRRSPKKPTDRRYEIELITGLERFVDDELGKKLGRRAYRLTGYPKEGRMSFRYSGPIQRLMDLRTAVAVHIVERFDVPRPKALLGHQHLTRLIDSIGAVIDLHPPETFSTFRVSAAGSESATMRRLRSEISAAIHLDEQTDDAHLLLSLRRSTSGGGWEFLVRLTPMPLSARPWRVCNRPDALNATVAHAMVTLPGHSDHDGFLNLGCGSGTLLIERLAAGPAASVTGLDIDPEAIICTERNLNAAGARQNVDLILGDIHSPPLPDASFNTAVADLPFGMLANTDIVLDRLYESALRETARLVVKDGAFTVITARRRLFEDTLVQHTDQWRRTAEVPLRISFQRGYIAPSIYLLRRM
ncbi:MAG: methyltransferase domain-containing protein [Dehalococcoidia bacterium]|nr:methyltransferase domain-containing protein [Dehalococcoidia bacterium]